MTNKVYEQKLGKGWFAKKTIYRREMPKKGGLGQFAD